MKKVMVTKKVWRRLHQIKRDQVLNNGSQTIAFLINSYVSKPEKPNKSTEQKLMKIHSFLDREG